VTFSLPVGAAATRCNPHKEITTDTRLSAFTCVADDTETDRAGVRN